MFTVTLPGGTRVKLADVPVGVLGDAARAAGRDGFDWSDVYYGPLKDDRAAVALFTELCRRAGDPVPDAEEITPGWLEERFVAVPDAEELPSSYEDGLPKEEAAEATP